MDDFTQQNRLISIKTALEGEDDLLLTSFKGSEHISDLFEFQLEVMSEKPDINPADIIGKPVTVTIHEKPERQFNGFINNLTQCESTENKLHNYKISMVPWLWFLTQNNNYRIFQEQTTQQIITDIFKETGFDEYDYKPIEASKPREYCVQYNESDFNFISRLLEEDGIAYYFEHKDGKHTLFIVDEIICFKNITNPDISYYNKKEDKQISHWLHKYGFSKGSWSVSDYNIKQPTKTKWHTKPTIGTVLNPKKPKEKTIFPNVNKYDHSSYEPYYDFAGLEDLSLKRIETEEASINKVEAKSNCSSFYAGGVFNLTNHTAKENGSYLITSVQHNAEEHSYFVNSKTTSKYTNEFKCIPSNVRYRPGLVHPKPVMSGPQSAVVIDRNDPDDMDRIKIRFPWNAEYQTCWIPVMQAWGASFVPNLNTEVVVGFYNGDVDRPLIMGGVFNGDNKSPYKNKHKHGIVSLSDNELAVDDTPGSEKVCVRSEKDLEVDVKNDQLVNVLKNFIRKITGDIDFSVKNKTETITGNLVTTVDGNQKETIKGDRNLKIEGTDHKDWLGSSHETRAGAKSEVYLGAKSSIHAGANLSMFGGLQTSVTNGITLTVNKTKELNKTKYALIEASEIYTINCPEIIIMSGANFISIREDRIEIKGKVIIKGNLEVEGEIKGKENIRATKEISGTNFDG